MMHRKSRYSEHYGTDNCDDFEISSNTKMELSEKSIPREFYSDHYNNYESTRTKYDVRRRYRSKSLSMLERETICPGEIRRIRERLLR